MTGEHNGHRYASSPPYRRSIDRAGIALPRAGNAADPEKIAHRAAASTEQAATRQRAGIRVGEIRGWRWWYVADGLLRSPFMDCTWLPHEPMAGDVANGFGIHVMKDRAAAAAQADKNLWFSSDHLWVWNDWRRRLPSPHTAYGSVRIWGEVVEHMAGYRAQFARVASIDGIYPENGELLAVLRVKYRTSSRFPRELKGFGGL